MLQHVAIGWPNVWNALRAKTFQDVACVWSGLKGPQTYHLDHHEKRELLNSRALQRYLVFFACVALSLRSSLIHSVVREYCACFSFLNRGYVRFLFLKGKETPHLEVITILRQCYLHRECRFVKVWCRTHCWPSVTLVLHQVVLARWWRTECGTWRERVRHHGAYGFRVQRRRCCGAHGKGWLWKRGRSEFWHNNFMYRSGRVTLSKFFGSQVTVC